MVAHTCNLSTQEADAGGTRVLGQPKICSKTLPHRKKENKYIEFKD
jgi:hypothetical protein